MTKTWKPTVAGILLVISGVMSVFCLIGVVIALILMGSGPFIWQFIPDASFPFVAGIIQAVLIIVAILCAIEAILPILSGVYAIQRKRWGWALTGSIIAILGTAPLGIAATILVALGKEEFA